MKAPSERHLEDWIVANWERFGESHHRRFAEYSMRLLERQYSVPCGRVDLIGTCSPYQPLIQVIELKKGAVTYRSIGQCLRYMRHLDHLAHLQTKEMIQSPERFELGVDIDPLVWGYVVGHSVEDDAVAMVAFQANIEVIIYDYDGEMYHFQSYNGGARHYEGYGFDPQSSIMKAVKEYRQRNSDEFIKNRLRNKQLDLIESRSNN